MLPLLMMMGGGQNADMIKTLSELGEGGKSPQELLPLFASMFSKNNAPPARPAPNPGPAEPSAPSRPAPSGAGSAQFFFPILDFAGEQIIYHLSLLLR